MISSLFRRFPARRTCILAFVAATLAGCATTNPMATNAPKTTLSTNPDKAKDSAGAAKEELKRTDADSAKRTQERSK